VAAPATGRWRGSPTWPGVEPPGPWPGAGEDLAGDASRAGERQRLALFDAVNLDAELGLAYDLKEAFRVAMAIAKGGDVEGFSACLDLFDALCRASARS
jgi:hypothetical protein